MSSENAEELQNLREKFDRFRILIVGRRNAGKTTILRGICNSIENPEIIDGRGKKVNPSKVEGSIKRGVHNIGDELIFRSNGKFVFHDSRGFEAGGEKEVLQMKKFIEDRAKNTHLKQRLHAIWYCIPMDRHQRAIQRSEERFFNECDPGNVPVIVLFTKFDALRTVALGNLAPADQQQPLEEQLIKAEPLIEEIFNQSDAWGRLSRLNHAPKFYVKIGDMNKSNKGCGNLLETTYSALDQQALQVLLISAQEVNLALCVKAAVQHLIDKTDEVQKGANIDELRLEDLVMWFPHHSVRESL